MKVLSYNGKIKELKKGAKKGFCRICGQYKDLTIDHVPPKSCGNSNRIKIVSANVTIISQNGLNCKTICRDCNNNLLGQNYDKALFKLYKEVLPFFSSKMLLGKVSFDVDVKKLVKCLLGHMLAINVYDEKDSVSSLLNKKLDDDKLIFGKYRKFVFNQVDFLDNTICYYWYYPYNEIVIYPYFCKADVLTPPTIKVLFGTLIKFFPIGLYLINSEHSNATIGCNRIDFNTNTLILDFRIKNRMPLDFPQKPSPSEIIMLNAGASFEVANTPFSHKKGFDT